MFSTDRDLLILEKRPFLSFNWPHQQLSAGEAEISDGQLYGATRPLLSANETHIVVINGTHPAEIVEITDEFGADLSSLRFTKEQNPIVAGLPTGPVSYAITTFDPQHQEVGQRLLDVLGVDAVQASQLVSTARLRVTALAGVCGLVYRSEMATSFSEIGETQYDINGVKARYYEMQFESLLRQLRVAADNGEDLVEFDLAAPKLTRR